MINFQEGGQNPRSAGPGRRIASGISSLLHPHFARFGSRGLGTAGIAKAILLQNSAVPHLGRMFR